jgi:hypothetical protein
MEVTSAHSVHRVTNLSQYKGENSLHKKTKKKENFGVCTVLEPSLERL